MNLNTTEEIIEDLRQGKMVVIMDDEDRENEGDLLLAADRVTPEAVNFMARYGRGLICLTLTKERCERLRLPLMVLDNQAPHSTAFTLSIEAASGVTTGISAADRATTVRAAVAPDAQPRDLVHPGHIFPLMAEPGGVLVRAGHTEAGCDLARLAGLEAGGGHRRDPQRGRRHGAAPGPGALRRRPRPQDRHHRRPDSLPRQS
jgi:3,4-dihydroxy 2-butanone 4-phosphate synthase/GTP cyclohydrolase II